MKREYSKFDFQKYNCLQLSKILIGHCLHQSVFKLNFVTWLNATFVCKLCFSCTSLQYTKCIVAFLVYKPKYPLAGLWNVRLKTRTQPKVTHMGKLVFDIQDFHLKATMQKNILQYRQYLEIVKKNTFHPKCLCCVFFIGVKFTVKNSSCGLV